MASKRKGYFDQIRNAMPDPQHDFEASSAGVSKPGELFSSYSVQESVAKKAGEIHSIPVSNLIVFQEKGDGDFSPWDEEDLKVMAENMAKDGPYQPIIVRQSREDNSVFEILAGEHRVKAARMKGIDKINAIIIPNCSDEQAKDIFVITNLQQRRAKVSDLIYGWSTFYRNHPNKRQTELGQEAYNISKEFGSGNQPISERQLYRYVSCARLLPDYIQALDAGKLSLRVATQISQLRPENQGILLPYAPKLTEELAGKIVAYEKENDLTEEWLSAFFSQKVTSYDSRLRSSMKGIRKYITKHFRPEDYDAVGAVIERALEYYYQSHKDPETASSLPDFVDLTEGQ